VPACGFQEAAHRTYFYGLRLHALVDDQGFLRRGLLCPAPEHEVAVAARLLQGLGDVVVTGDKGYLSQALKAQAARQGVDLKAQAEHEGTGWSKACFPAWIGWG
jgi:hypothetical protein